MTTTETQRADELAARFTASKEAIAAGVAERRAIVAELLTLMPAPKVAELLGISLARVGQIVGGVRK